MVLVLLVVVVVSVVAAAAYAIGEASRARALARPSRRLIEADRLLQRIQTLDEMSPLGLPSNLSEDINRHLNDQELNP